MRFETLRETLLKAGIAPRHVHRYLKELDDHLADLTQAQIEAGHGERDAALRARALLGEDQELAAAMLAEPRFRSWPARAPWLVFGLLPPIASLACFIVVPAPLGLIAHFDGTWMQHRMPAPMWFQIWANSTAFAANFGLGPVLAALMVWAAHRQRLNWKWPVLATAIIALAGFHMITRFSEIPGRGNQIAIGTLQVLRIFGHYSPTPHWEMLAQFFLTLAPALWLLRDWRFARLTEPR